MSRQEASEYLRLDEWWTDIRAQADRLGALLGPSAVAGPIAALVRVRSRLELGVDHTIVALLGGTGSGKSSLFNAISAMTFAQVSPRRPTTTHPVALIWGGRAERLMQWLGLSETQWMVRDSQLDARDHSALHGLILLDLPDYDSVIEAHREQVERVLPLADVMIWVLDPQKYADRTAHAEFLSGLVGLEANLIVVVNQIDRVPAHERGALLEDLAQLLRHDGLRDVMVLATSAATGEGVDALRAILVTATARQPSVARRVETELSLVAASLLSLVGPADPADERLRMAAAAQRTRELALDLSGVRAIAHSLSYEATAITPVALGDEAGAELRATWLDGLGASVQRGWASAIVTAIAGPTALADAVSTAISSIVPPPKRGLLSRVFGGRQAPRQRAELYLAEVAQAVDDVLTTALVSPTSRVLRLRWEVEAGLAPYLPDR